MKNCEECHEECEIKGKFDVVFASAADDLKAFYARQRGLSVERFWPEFEVLYHKYPECVMIALDEVIMSAHMLGQRLDTSAYSK